MYQTSLFPVWPPVPWAPFPGPGTLPPWAPQIGLAFFLGSYPGSWVPPQVPGSPSEYFITLAPAHCQPTFLTACPQPDIFAVSAFGLMELAARPEELTASPADLEKLVSPLMAGYYCPEHAADAAGKLLLLLEANPKLCKLLPAGLRDDVSSHLLTEDDEDIAHTLLKLVRKLKHVPHAALPETMDARVLDGATSQAHWSLHAGVSAEFDDPSIYFQARKFGNPSLMGDLSSRVGEPGEKHAWAISWWTDTSESWLTLATPPLWGKI